MRLIAVTIQKFKNFVEAQCITIEPDVTGLVGKNESGKTTILKASDLRQCVNRRPSGLRFP